MNDQQLNQALTVAAQNSNELAQLVKFAMESNFDCPDARAAAKVAGEVLIGKSANESTIIQSMGAAYEAVLFTAMHKAGRINPPNQQYATRISDVFNQVVRMINSLKQDQGRTQGNGTGIFSSNSSGSSSIFSKQESSGGLFTKQESTSQSSLFGAKKDEPLFASAKQEEVSSSIFGNSEEPAKEASVATTAQPTTVTGQSTMESLIAHETETTLRATCVSARQMSDSIALYKEALLDENIINCNDAEIECRIKPTKRTPIQLSVVNNTRTFQIGEGETTDRTISVLHEDINKFLDEVQALQNADFNNRLVSKAMTTAIALHGAVSAYAETAREHEALETLTVTDATRAATAVTTELYRALAIAIDYVSEDNGIPNADGTGYVHFELDFSNFKEEAEQLEEFFLSYEGKQASTFELLFCQFVRALAWVRIGLHDDVLTVGKREIRAELPYPIFDGVEIGAHHKLLERESMGENLDLLCDLADVIEKRLPAARLFVIDGLYRTAYIDRAYDTCRPKAVLQ